jgi:hypothetical protein
VNPQRATCTTCGSSGPFATDRRNSSGRAARCKRCAYAAAERCRKRNPAAHCERTKAWYAAHPWARKGQRLRARYGITLADYERMLAQQRTACAICRAALVPGSTHVDHCHRTGKVRGLLCGHCNKALGLFRDDAEVIRAAVQYLGGSHGV